MPQLTLDEYFDLLEQHRLADALRLGGDRFDKQVVPTKNRMGYCPGPVPTRLVSTVDVNKKQKLLLVEGGL
jgi:hypothetical protein